MKLINRQLLKALNLPVISVEKEKIKLKMDGGLKKEENFSKIEKKIKEKTEKRIDKIIDRMLDNFMTKEEKEQTVAFAKTKAGKKMFKSQIKLDIIESIQKETYKVISQITLEENFDLFRNNGEIPNKKF